MDENQVFVLEYTYQNLGLTNINDLSKSEYFVFINSLPQKFLANKTVGLKPEDFAYLADLPEINIAWL